MQAILNQINAFVTTLNTIDPAWYIVLVGPLANIAQHFLKKERDFTRNQNKLIAIVLPALAGAFYAALHTTAGATFATSAMTFLKNTAIIGTPIYLVAQGLYHAVSAKIEIANAVQASTLPVAGTIPASVPAPAVAAAPTTPVEPTPTGV